VGSLCLVVTGCGPFGLGPFGPFGLGRGPTAPGASGAPEPARVDTAPDGGPGPGAPVCVVTEHEPCGIPVPGVYSRLWPVPTPRDPRLP
jgi:hypothetical protein